MTINNGQTTTVTRNYILQTGSGSLECGSSSYSEAVAAGAQWNVDGGSWQNSGATVSDLSVGSHTVNYKSVSAWSAPASEPVTINSGQTTQVTRNYTLQTGSGSLSVTLGPSEAVAAGAQWNVDGGSWQNSGATVSILSVGSHTVNYKPVPGWSEPVSETATINNNQTTQISSNYTQQSGSVIVTLGPAEAVSAGAQWNVDGGSWQDSGATVLGLSIGGHTINYKSLSGWNAPISESTTINDGQTTQITRNYYQLSFDYFVAPPSLGNDNNDGINPTTPFATIQHAIDAAQGSESNPVTIHVAAGTYYENIQMHDWESLEGGWNSNFSQRWDFEFDGINPAEEFETIIDGLGDSDVIVASANSSISGFTIMNAGNNSGIRSESTNLIIKFNKFTGSMGAGIYIGLGGSAAIESNFIFNLDIANSVGIDFGTAEALTPISNNLIVGNKGDGIRAGLSTINHIINNTIYGNDGWGIFLLGVSSNVKNNIIAQNSGGINLQGATSTVGFNCVWNNTILGDYNFTPTPGTGEINEDPLFVDPDGPDNILGNEDDNLHLGYGSPCVNAGTADGVNPDGSTDMGVYPSVTVGTTDWAGRACDYSTIQGGIDEVHNLGKGGTVLVTPGVYTENVTLKPYIDLIGQGANNTTIDGGGIGDVVTLENNNCMRGFNIKNSGTSGPDCGIQALGNKIVIERNTFTDVRSGIWLTGNDNIIKNNVITVKIDSGIIIGSFTGTNSLHPLIENNTVDGISRNGSTGIICLSSGSTPKIINNIISNFSSQGIYVQSYQDPEQIRYNCFWNNGENFYGVENQIGVNGNIEQDPQFINSSNNNYHLESNSPCIDAGDNNIFFDEDFEGDPRIFDGDINCIPIVDIGADEYIPTVIVPPAPANLRALPGNGFIDLQWDSPTCDGGYPIVSYKIFRGTSSGMTAPYVAVGTVTNFRDDGLSNGTMYYYNVTAINSIGNESALSLEVSTAPAPINYCEADFPPFDGDVDGSDLASFIVDNAGISLSEFAQEFGRMNCP